jgi:hypothetical protein
MPAPRQRPTEQCLLNRFATDGVLPVFRRQNRKIVDPDEADLHRLTRSASSSGVDWLRAAISSRG